MMKIYLLIHLCENVEKELSKLITFTMKSFDWFFVQGILSKNIMEKNFNTNKLFLFIYVF